VLKKEKWLFMGLLYRSKYNGGGSQGSTFNGSPVSEKMKGGLTFNVDRGRLKAFCPVFS
jgi:hypothetical protein